MEKICTLKIDNIFTTIEGVYPVSELDKALSYYIPNFFMMPQYRLCRRCRGNISPKTKKCTKCGTSRAWDGRKHFLLGGNRNLRYFPTGCLSIVIATLKQSKFGYQIIDARKTPFLPDTSLVESLELIDPDNPNQIRKLWGHQAQAVSAALSAGRGLLMLPTRAGKTSCMAGILKLIPLKSAIYINNKSISRQLREEVSGMLGEKVGLIGDGKLEIERVTVCMIQTLQNELSLIPSMKKEPKNPLIVEWANSVQTMIHDEVHHIGDNIWYEMTKQFPAAYFRYGVSGTIDMRSSGDDMLTMAATGKVIYQVSEQELIENGIIARPIIHLYQVDNPSDLEDASYQTAYDQAIVQNNTFLNKPAADMIRRLADNGEQVLVLAERMEHIQNIQKFLDGVDYEVLTGETDSDFRERVKENFVNSKLRVILASKIFDEGVTLSNIDWVVRMGMMKTKIKTKQQVGRGQAKKKNKPNEVHIADFVLTMNPHLRNHSFERYEVYRDLGYEVRLEGQLGGLL